MKERLQPWSLLIGFGVALLFLAIVFLAVNGTLRNVFSPPPPLDAVVATAGGENITFSEIYERDGYLKAARRAKYIRDPLFRQMFFMERQTNTRFTYDGSDQKQFHKKQLLLPLVNNRLILAKAQELKLYPLSEADQAAIHSLAHQFYQSYTTICKQDGVTEELLEKRFTEIKTAKLLMDEVTKSITAPEEELKTAYDQLHAYEKRQFLTNPSYYDNMMSGRWIEILRDRFPNGTSQSPEEFVRKLENIVMDECLDTVIVYRPEGYRLFQHLIFPISDAYTTEVQARLKKDGINPNDKQKVSLIREEVIYDLLKRKAEEALVKVKAGASFEELMLPSLSDSPYVFDPYSSVFMRAEFQIGPGTHLEPEMAEPVAALARVGDITDPVRTALGCHILKWVGDVPAGPVPYEEVKDQIEAALLYDERAAAWAAALAQWREEAKAEFFTDKLPPDLPAFY